MKEINQFIGTLRYNFGKKRLDAKTAKKNPMEQFRLWFAEAIQEKLHEPNAMILSTALKSGKPSSRIVLLRDADKSGFTFYTNYTSRKGKEIDENPCAALLFYWAQIEKQVRIEGVIEKVSDKKSNDYFNSRPRESRIGAWISQQSHVIVSRQALEKKYADMDKKFPGQKIPRPHFWGGYVLKPTAFEFWQGRENRLHDRLLYSKTKSGWMLERLSP